MPANCSADVRAVIAQIDKVFSGTNQAAINQLKNLFGLGGLSHLDDVAAAREFPALKLGPKCFLMNLITSSKQLVAMAGVATILGPQRPLLPVLRCLGGQEWGLCSGFWMGTGTCFTRLGKLLQDVHLAFK